MLYKDKSEEQVNQKDDEHAEEKLRVQVVPQEPSLWQHRSQARWTSCKLKKSWSRIMIFYTSEIYKESLDSGIIFHL